MTITVEFSENLAQMKNRLFVVMWCLYNSSMSNLTRKEPECMQGPFAGKIGPHCIIIIIIFFILLILWHQFVILWQVCLLSITTEAIFLIHDAK